MKQPTLAVDTQVVMIGCGMAGFEPADHYCVFLASFHFKAFLALDKHTEQEYAENMGDQSEGKAWLRKLGEQDRIDYFEETPIEKRGTKVALLEIGFSKKDTKFVRLALATDTKILVAEEPHFRDNRKLLKKKEGLLILDASEACEYIGANQGDTPAV